MDGAPVLSCPVRGCGLPLASAERRLACSAGHSFDRARSGYVNLLQPQDRRSRAPGDPKEAVAARRRLAETDLDRVLVEAVVAWARARALRAEHCVLDVGAGVGTLLGALARALPCRAFGLDLAVAAVDAAARRHPSATWIVANADRRLPFLDASLAALLSVKGPKNPDEFARVLAPGGHLLVVVPGTDDLVELRTETAGRGLAHDPAERALARFEPRFELAERRACRDRRTLDPAALADLARIAYRGVRRAEAERLAALPGLAVTTSATLLHLRPRA